MSPGEGGATVFALSVGLAFSPSLGFSLDIFDEFFVRQVDEGFEILVWRGRTFL